MKKRQLKIFTLIVTPILAGSIVFTTNQSLASDSQNIPPASAESSQSSSATETPKNTDGNSVLRLSLEDALKSIETGNSTLQLTDSKILIYEKQYQQALARHNANYSEVDEDSAKARKLNHKRTLWTLENAKHDRDTQLENLKVLITNQYQSILALQQQEANLKVQLKNVDTLINQLNLQIDLGMTIQSQIYSLNAQRSSLEAGLKATQNSVKSSMIAFKRDLGIDLNREVVLTSDLLTYEKFDDAKLEEQIAKAIENDYDNQRYEQDIELTQIEYDIAFYYDNPSADQFQISVEDKKATLEALPVTKQVSLRTAYNDLKSLENSIEAARLAVEADKINMEILQKKIDVGVSSSIEIIEIQNKLLNDQYALLQDINSYMAAKASFTNSLDN
ncbi:hypothetical protein Desdi_3217 [Desulfitobacterium dichloroeliminans LMG P-21439]|uniref:Outer membrane protein n=1 Tax=Desulfitobacterium dichloroeliminans (strain LMG P-21439 / DCA1) TaxID=871963 RepID=L0FD96_DESDL|nr:TolC family protein [Desulfitobacterium dichloroeliminans]AGA70611.1 hypothetical protein Desdi_3217 [Desulfitobacterium dichloroeliminans LMG P-21439]